MDESGEAMSEDEPDLRTPAERVDDLPEILAAINRGVQAALRQHKRAGNPVAIWQDGAVVWVPSEEIPVDDELEARLDSEPPIRFTACMKATIEVPDDLYRRVEEKSAIEGRAVREVAIELFRGYLGREFAASGVEATAAEDAKRALGGREIPRWFGALEKYARRVERHDMEAIRESIARGISVERGL
jgi:hypothetical protein